MCTALEEMKMDSEREGERKGEIKGSVETYKEFHCSLEDTILYDNDRFIEKESMQLYDAPKVRRRS